ncbi:hypothetical protein [Pseudoalteromonas sp. H105]|jgi:hypothetical protein|uniref:hypothetical protein n=1 Tax=Pseudoalteromonas sp. H105 TaxID=1348393 RepID=UPI000B313957|nr:hypothetical protein [Pseudoalteromonas sp. H105]
MYNTDDLTRSESNQLLNVLPFDRLIILDKSALSPQHRTPFLAVDTEKPLYSGFKGFF